RFFLLAQLQRREKRLRLPNGQRRHPIDRPARNLDVARLAAQPRTAAVRAREIAAVAAEEHAHVDFVLLALEPAEEPADPLVLAVLRGSIDHETLLVLRQLRPRHFEPDSGLAGGTLEIGELGAV